MFSMSKQEGFSGAIVEGLAERIVKNDVPSSLLKKRVIGIEISSLLAGASFRGQFEERIKALLKEVEEASGEIILFIDEIHTIVGAGKSEGSMDVANMLKPMMARGQLHLIGATTLNEYRENIEKDAALERRLQPVYVGEPSIDDTIAILRGLQEKYEVHHGVKIKDDAIVAAAKLSNRYISDRFLPDKAVDLIDEATSALKMQLDSKPIDVDRLDRKIMQLQIEDRALKKDNSDQANLRKKEIETEINELKQKASDLDNKWQKEKDLISKVNEVSALIESQKAELDRASSEGDLARAAKLQYGDIPENEKKLATLREEINKIPEKDRLLKDEVDVDDIASVVARWTGIPVNRLMESETKRLLNLESELRKRVVGQDRAVELVSDAIRRSRAGIGDQNRPIGSFLFLGPTGVGKTELAKSLAEALFDDERSMVRIDMSEYMEAHSVARLIGSPPGYIGFDKGGQLTEAVRRRPYSIVLLDEIEKAHQDVFNVLLQVLDDGRLTDGQGRTVNFTNTIIIMTSNVGSEKIIESKEINKDLEQKLLDDLRHYFRPEFINRIDDIIVFNKISKENMKLIVDTQLKKLVDELKVTKDITLEITDNAKNALTDQGFDTNFGARPLKRLIQKEILNKLAKELIKGDIKEQSKVTVDYKDNTFVVLN